MLLKKTTFSLCLIGISLLASCTNNTNEVPDCPACSLVPDAGMCNAAFQKFYFDSTTQQCKAFVWGGCGGVVPFQTLEKCEACACD